MFQTYSKDGDSKTLISIDGRILPLKKNQKDQTWQVKMEMIPRRTRYDSYIAGPRKLSIVWFQKIPI